MRLSVQSVAERYEVSKATVWRWVKEGRMPAPVKMGSSTTRWVLADLEKWESTLIPIEIQ
jgi:prophage regulatory protein